MRAPLRPLRLISASLLYLVLTAHPARAFDFDGGFGPAFPKFVKSIEEQGGAPVAGPSTAAVSSELQIFWENLKRDTFDNLCKSAEIKLNKEGKLENVLGLGGEFKRYLRKDPKGKLFLVDEVKAELTTALGHDLLSIPDIGPLNINFSGVLQGKSLVVQPLENDEYCKELLTLAKLYKVKTVLPASARRIAEMKPGELWKVPLILRMGFGIGVGTVINEVVNVSVSAGLSRESKPSVTLYRLDAGTLRLRLRLDRIEVKSVGASASTLEIPMENIGLISGENLLAREINRSWAREVNNYIAARLSYGHSRFSGKKLLLEFVLNPGNPEQMASLENFLQGDFGILKRFIELGLRFNNISEDDETSSGLGEIAGTAEQAGQAINSDSSFAGTDLYHGHSDGFNIQIPVLHTHNSSWSSSYNRYQSLDNEGETLHVNQQRRVSNGSSLDVPFLGKMTKYDSQKNVYVVNRESKDGTVTRPVFMYQQYEGFVRRSDGTARDMVENANGVLRYVGMGGNGTDNSNSVPANLIFPALPQAPYDPYAEDVYTQTSKTYRAAVMGFKLLINERGVQDIIFAPARAIMRAYLNMMCELYGAIIRKVSELFTIGKSEKVEYDAALMRKALGVSANTDYENPTDDPMNTVYFLARDAGRVIKDFASVKDAATWKAQSEKLSEVAAGKSKSGLKYEDLLKVAVQLVNPLDVFAEVYLHTDKRRDGEADVTQNYQFFNTGGNNFDNTISGVNQMRERFAEPSLLGD